MSILDMTNKLKTTKTDKRQQSGNIYKAVYFNSVDGYEPNQVGCTSYWALSINYCGHIYTRSCESHQKNSQKYEQLNQTHFIESSSRRTHPSLSKVQRSTTFHLVVGLEPNRVVCVLIWTFYIYI